MSRIGDIYNLPTEEHPDPDRKPGRPWLLVHSPAEEAARWVFAYGTTQNTEEVEGATALDIRWRRLSGQLSESRFFMVRLRSEVPMASGNRVGYARAHNDEIRASLSAALGIGTGVGTGTAGTIERGQVVALHSLVRERIGARYAILVTRPDYAARRRHQLLVPIYYAEDVDLQHGEIMSSAPWVSTLPGAPSEVVIAAPSLFSECESGKPRSPGGITGVVRTRLDCASMTGVDDALRGYLDL
ncbi:MAG TPA: hypothetical protein VGO40_15205 [Longimicrobium sp.]|jgi:hypothetical protein|nr:hypothetical protein [Longimicrobium sp.]